MAPNILLAAILLQLTCVLTVLELRRVQLLVEVRLGVAAALEVVGSVVIVEVVAINIVPVDVIPIEVIRVDVIPIEIVCVNVVAVEVIRVNVIPVVVIVAVDESVRVGDIRVVVVDHGIVVPTASP